MDINKLVVKFIETDDCYLTRYNKSIENVYNNSNEETKNAINSIFINLCGFSLETIINDSKKERGITWKQYVDIILKTLLKVLYIM